MKEKDEGIVSALKREPGQAKLLLEVILGGALAIVAWDVLSVKILPDIATFGVMLAMILAYACFLTVLIARLVKAMDRWQVESAKQATRLATTRRRIDRPSGETVLPPLPQANFQQTYFLLRLNEEVKEARRRGHLLSLIALDVTVPHQAMTPDLTDQVAFEMAQIAADHARTISVPLSTGATEFMFCLPETDGRGVKSFTSNLVQSLGKYWCHFGIVTYPEDGTDAETLFNRAREACELSRQDGELSKRPEHVA